MKIDPYLLPCTGQVEVDQWLQQKPASPNLIEKKVKTSLDHNGT